MKIFFYPKIYFLEECHKSCWTCSGSSSDQCKSCKDLQVLTQNKETGVGSCSSECTRSQYAKDGICHGKIKALNCCTFHEN